MLQVNIKLEVNNKCKYLDRLQIGMGMGCRVGCIMRFSTHPLQIKIVLLKKNKVGKNRTLDFHKYYTKIASKKEISMQNESSTQQAELYVNSSSPHLGPRS